MHASVRFDAGHSHWQNVRHIKEAKDHAKSKAIALYTRLIAQSIKEGNGIRDPKINGRLASVLEHAKAQSVPMATIKRILEQDNIIDPYCIEVQGPGGIFILVESRNKNLKAEKERNSFVYSLKLPSTAGQITREFFVHQGSIIMKGFFKNHDEAMDAAIECGASEVDIINDASEDYFKFTCDSDYLNPVKENLEKFCNQGVFEYCDEYVASSTVEVSKETSELLEQFYEKLRSNIDTVDRIYDNIEVTS
ncbi:Translational activator of mitochondrially encoded cytochrome c oxidase I [Cichlidogyrus casuarinus]|uniref:Translational activator of mitochondrially encoded cytochrome c oxidase I n=1 Tax=Cichlidogyrus casuarinus TaxID=1844966 RepID=A0ABD2QM80_9PLAT